MMALDYSIEKQGDNCTIYPHTYMCRNNIKLETNKKAMFLSHLVWYYVKCNRYAAAFQSVYSVRNNTIYH